MLSVWSGPPLADDAQPTIVGIGAALAIVAGQDSLHTLTNPSFQELSRALLPTPRPENPGLVANQPHMKHAGQAWLEIINSFDVEGGAEFSTATGLRAPLGLMSFGFAPGTPGVLLLPRLAWVNSGGRTWTIEVLPDGEHALRDAGQNAPDGAGARVNGTVFGNAGPDVQPNEGGHPDGEALGTAQALGAVQKSWYLDPGTMSRTAWKHAVAMVVGELREGAAEKAVMARDITARTDQTIDLSEVLLHLAAVYPTTWIFSVAGLTGATPEMLASVREGALKSRVLAGTSAPGAGEQLWESAKDCAEHALAVKSVVDALGPLSSDLEAPEQPFLLDLPNVTHLASDVSAKLTSVEAGLAPVCEVVRALHPTAAVCGTPTQAAFEMLSKHELTDRGRYSGPVGWIDGAGEGACGIALRCGQMLPDAHSIRVFAGGGIMPDSDPEVELAETQAKMLPLLQAIGLEH